MTPDELRYLTGVITCVGFIALVHQLSWQVRIGLSDRQAKSAFFFLFMTMLVMGQLMVSYLGGPTMGNTHRGVITYVIWVASLVWWSFCTLRHNAIALKKLREAKRQHKDATTKLRRPLGGFREQGE
jgi:hypothetical protein